jgi:hypothetical protein
MVTFLAAFAQARRLDDILAGDTEGVEDALLAAAEALDGLSIYGFEADLQSAMDRIRSRFLEQYEYDHGPAASSREGAYVSARVDELQDEVCERFLAAARLVVAPVSVQDVV